LRDSYDTLVLDLPSLWRVGENESCLSDRFNFTTLEKCSANRQVLRVFVEVDLAAGFDAGRGLKRREP
jgi:hypothetical protein